MSDIRVCAVNAIQAEFTLCGDSFDCFATGDAEEDHVLADIGQTVNCEQCCKIIADIRSMKYRLKPRNQSHDQ